MGMRPDGMERWGVEAILKESGRLLHKHYRLFLPFYLAFYLPSSIAGIFQTVFLAPSATPLHYASFVNSTSTPAQGSDTVGGQVVPIIVSWTLLLVVSVLGTLGVGAVAYIVAYIYSNADSDDDRSIVKKVFKLLPHAFLRMWVTLLWTILVIFLLYIFSLIIAGILYAIISAATGWSNHPMVLLLALVPFLAGCIFLIIMFAFAQFIAVLEPEKYGREALKRSTKMARTGRAGTIVAVFLVSIIVSAVLIYPTQAIASGMLPLWEEIIVGASIGFLNSVIGAYFGVVSAVMYFVYTSRFDAVTSRIPEFKSGSSTANSYEPLVPENVYPTSIGEP